MNWEADVRPAGTGDGIMERGILERWDHPVAGIHCRIHMQFIWMAPFLGPRWKLVIGQPRSAQAGKTGRSMR